MVFKLNSSGTYQWHTFHGSTNDDYGNAISVDGNGYIYLTGESYATWLVLVNGMTYRSPDHAHSGGSDIVAVKLDSSGMSMWHTFYGSAGWDEGNSIALDQSGNVFITGESHGSWLGAGSASPKYAYQGGWDIIGLKLKNSGEYNGHSFFGSTMDDYGNGIAVDKIGNLYITGHSEAS